MLELRPNCEWCDVDLPPDSADARICSYECTYCADCVARILKNVCPTCGGGFAPRPIRPKTAYRENPKLGLGHHPATTERTHSRWQESDLTEMTARLKDIPPADR